MKQRSISLVRDTSRKITVADCATGVSIGFKPTLDQVAVLIRELSIMAVLLGKKMDEKTAAMMADAILNFYPTESLETLVVILRMGGGGVVGEKIFGNFGLAHFNEWAKEYTQAVQNERVRLNKNKEFKKEDAYESRAQYLEAVKVGELAQKEIARVKKQGKDKENGYKVYKSDFLNKAEKPK